MRNLTAFVRGSLHCARWQKHFRTNRFLGCERTFSLNSRHCGAAPSLLHSNDGSRCAHRREPARNIHTSPCLRDSGADGKVPMKTQVVISGGGVIGCSIAFHLAQAGWTDVVLLEQGSLACGTTWHAAGLVGRSRGSDAETAIVDYSAKLYKQLEDEGYGTGWKQCGSLNICRTKDRVISYKRSLLKAERFGIESVFLTPKEIEERYPHIKTDDLQGGYFIPGDGVVSPTDVAMAMAKKAREMGVKIVEKCKVQRVLTRNGRVCGVLTDGGNIDCDYFVNSSGQWARDLGQLSDPSVRVPLHSCEHFYIVTKSIDGVDSMFPVVRDYDGYVYLREWSGGFLAGGFEPHAKPVFHEGVPEKFEFQLLPEDWDHFQVLLEQLIHRFPAIAEAEVRQFTNGPESFTPDGKYIIGEAPEVNNYFVAAGMNSSGIAAAGGVGKYLSEWMMTGEPSMDFWGLDIRRFVDLHNNKNFLKERVKETLGSHSIAKPVHVNQLSRNIRTTPLYPRLVASGGIFTELMGYERASYYNQQQSCFGMFATNCGPHMAEAMYKTGRNLRMPPMFPRFQADGATFGEICGYERPLWFKPRDLDEFQEVPEEPNRGSFGKPQWFEKVRSEYWACREGVSLIDMSTFSKFELRSAGTEVVDFLQHVCSNDVNRPPGSIIHTGMHNHRGGYENDCSVVRLAENRYFMISPTAQQTRSFKWLKDHLPEDGSVLLSDVTSMYTAVNVIGPKAQELLAELTKTKLGTQHFMHMTCKEIDVGMASGIKAMRLTHSGEDGWMLYIPSEYALHVYDSLMEAGKNYGVRNAGYYALRALRTEKFFAYWGTDLTPFVTPLECGREYRVKLDQGGFIGYQAILRQKSEGIKKRLVQLLLENHNLDEDPWPWGGEPIYRNGVFCGMTTSTAYGFTLDRHVCLGYVQDLDPSTGEANVINNDFILKNAKFEVDIAGQKFPAKAGIYPPKLASAAIVI